MPYFVSQIMVNKYMKNGKEVNIIERISHFLMEINQ